MATEEKVVNSFFVVAKATPSLSISTLLTTFVQTGPVAQQSSNKACLFQ